MATEDKQSSGEQEAPWGTFSSFGDEPDAYEEFAEEQADVVEDEPEEPQAEDQQPEAEEPAAQEDLQEEPQEVTKTFKLHDGTVISREQLTDELLNKLVTQSNQGLHHQELATKRKREIEELSKKQQEIINNLALQQQYQQQQQLAQQYQQQHQQQQQMQQQFAPLPADKVS